MPRPAVLISPSLPPGRLDSTTSEGGRGGRRWPRTVSAPSRTTNPSEQQRRRKRSAGERLILQTAWTTSSSGAVAALLLTTKGGVLCRPTVVASGQEPGRER